MLFSNILRIFGVYHECYFKNFLKFLQKLGYNKNISILDTLSQGLN